MELSNIEKIRALKYWEYLSSMSEEEKSAELIKLLDDVKVSNPQLKEVSKKKRELRKENYEMRLPK